MPFDVSTVGVKGILKIATKNKGSFLEAGKQLEGIAKEGDLA